MEDRQEKQTRRRYNIPLSTVVVNPQSKVLLLLKKQYHSTIINPLQQNPGQNPISNESRLYP